MAVDVVAVDVAAAVAVAVDVAVDVVRLCCVVFDMCHGLRG